jgi:hypothetical protein
MDEIYGNIPLPLLTTGLDCDFAAPPLVRSSNMEPCVLWDWFNDGVVSADPAEFIKGEKTFDLDGGIVWNTSHEEFESQEGLYPSYAQALGIGWFDEDFNTMSSMEITDGPRRGSLRSTYDKEQTAQTRKHAACVRCKMQRIRVCVLVSSPPRLTKYIF